MRVPFLGRDDARQKIGRDDPLGRLIVAIDGEGDALVQEGLFAGLLAAPQFFPVEFGEPAMQGRAVRPDRAVGREHLVISAGEDIVFVRRIAARPRAPRFGLFYARCYHPMLHMRSGA